MRKQRIVVFLWVAITSMAGSLRAEEPVDDKEQVRQVAAWIEQLGHKRFVVRERATKRLTDLGVPAMGQLRLASRSANREVRFRSQTILNSIQQADFEQRVSLFAEGRGSELPTPLPGWTAFREKFGDTPESRSLFVLMQKQERRLMEAFGRNPGSAARLLNQRFRLVQDHAARSESQPSVGSIAALLLVVGHDGVTVNSVSNQYIMNYLFSQTFKVEMNGTSGSKRDLLKGLLGPFVAQADGDNLHQVMALALEYGLKESLSPARRILTTTSSRRSFVLPGAIFAVARFGGKEDIRLLDGLLDDRTAYTRSALGDQQTQICDLALAAAIHLSKREYRDFGFHNVRTDAKTVFVAESVGFRSSEDRDEAIQTWRAVQAKAAE